MAFIAPKIIGGETVPSPVGVFGLVEMTQAIELVDTHWEQVGPDLLMTGFLPSSGGLASGASRAKEAAAAARSVELCVCAATTVGSSGSGSGSFLPDTYLGPTRAAAGPAPPPRRWPPPAAGAAAATGVGAASMPSAPPSAKNE